MSSVIPVRFIHSLTPSSARKYVEQFANGVTILCRLSTGQNYSR